MDELTRTNAVREKVKRLGIYPIDILLVGPTGVGKSSTLNALFGRNISKVGDSPDPETMDTPSFMLCDNCVRFWDSPGLGDSPEKDRFHREKIHRLLYSTYVPVNSSTGKICSSNCYGYIDLVLVIIDGSSRDIGTACRLVNDEILPAMGKSRILFAVNKCDMAMRGQHWDTNGNVPDEKLMRQISDNAKVFGQRISDYCGIRDMAAPINYSAVKKYNINGLFNEIMKKIPDVKRRAPK